MSVAGGRRRQKCTMEGLLNARGGPLVDDELWAILTESIKKLQSMSTENLLQLLLTPWTIGFSPAGAVLFGLVKRSEGQDTQAYVPPEMSRLTARSPRSRLFLAHMYSLGVVLYQAADNMLPSHLEPDLSPALEDVLAGLAEDDPQDRISMEEARSIARRVRVKQSLPQAAVVIARLHDETAVCPPVAASPSAYRPTSNGHSRHGPSPGMASTPSHAQRPYAPSSLALNGRSGYMASPGLSSVGHSPAGYRNGTLRPPAINGSSPLVRHATVTVGPDPAGLGGATRPVEVILLTGEKLMLETMRLTRVRDVFNDAIRHLGIKEPAFFGLATQPLGARYFLTMDDPMWRYFPAERRDDVILTVYLLVEYYVGHVSVIQHLNTRHMYYKQVLFDIVRGYIYVPREAALHLGSFALQAHYGPVDLNDPPPGYFNANDFFPKHVVLQMGHRRLLDEMPGHHAKFKTLSQMDAEKEFLKQAQKVTEYGSTFYPVSRSSSKRSGKRDVASLGTSIRGIVLYDIGTEGLRKVRTQHPWKQIKSLSHDGRQIKIKTLSGNSHRPKSVDSPRKVVVFAEDEDEAAYILTRCRAMHRFDKLLKETYPEQASPIYRSTSTLQTTPMLPGLVDISDMQTMVSEGRATTHAAPTTPTAPATNGRPTVSGPVGIAPRSGRNVPDSPTLPVASRSRAQPQPQQPPTSNGSSPRTGRVLPTPPQARRGVNGGSTVRSDPAAAAPAARFAAATANPTIVAAAAAPPTAKPTATKREETLERNLRLRKLPSSKFSDPKHVQIEKGGDGLGITLCGVAGQEEHTSGIFIQEIRPDGAAARDGRLHVHDRILEVNGVSTAKLKHQQVVDLIKKSPRILDLLIANKLASDKKKKSSRPVRRFWLKRMPGGDPGFRFVASRAEAPTFHVTEVLPGSLAADHGLSLGDQLLAINGKSLKGLNSQQAAADLRNCRDEFSVKVYQRHDSEASLNGAAAAATAAATTAAAAAATATAADQRTSSIDRAATPRLVRRADADEPPATRPREDAARQLMAARPATREVEEEEGEARAAEDAGMSRFGKRTLPKRSDATPEDREAPAERTEPRDAPSSAAARFGQRTVAKLPAAGAGDAPPREPSPEPAASRLFGQRTTLRRSEAGGNEPEPANAATTPTQALEEPRGPEAKPEPEPRVPEPEPEPKPEPAAPGVAALAAARAAPAPRAPKPGPEPVVAVEPEVDLRREVERFDAASAVEAAPSPGPEGEADPFAKFQFEAEKKPAPEPPRVERLERGPDPATSALRSAALSAGLHDEATTSGMRIVTLERPMQAGFGFNLKDQQLGHGGTIVTVKKVKPGSPADQAGLCSGDALHEINGTNVEYHTKDEATAILKDLPVEARLLVERGGRQHPLRLKKGEPFGVHFYETERGVFVRDVQPGSVANTQGLEVGHEVLHVDSSPVDELTLDQIEHILYKSPKVVLSIQEASGGDVEAEAEAAEEELAEEEAAEEATAAELEVPAGQPAREPLGQAPDEELGEALGAPLSAREALTGPPPLRPSDGTTPYDFVPGDDEEAAGERLEPALVGARGPHEAAASSDLDASQAGDSDDDQDAPPPPPPASAPPTDGLSDYGQSDHGQSDLEEPEADRGVGESGAHLVQDAMGQEAGDGEEAERDDGEDTAKNTARDDDAPEGPRDDAAEDAPETDADLLAHVPMRLSRESSSRSLHVIRESIYEDSTTEAEDDTHDDHLPREAPAPLIVEAPPVVAITAPEEETRDGAHLDASGTGDAEHRAPSPSQLVEQFLGADAGGDGGDGAAGDFEFPPPPALPPPIEASGEEKGEREAVELPDSPPPAAEDVAPEEPHAAPASPPAAEQPPAASSYATKLPIRKGGGDCTVGEIEDIEFVKDAASIGVSISGGTETALGAIFLSSVVAGSAAHQDGRIQVGDRLVELNGQDFKHETHKNVVSALQAAGARVSLVVQHLGRKQWQQLLERALAEEALDDDDAEDGVAAYEPPPEFQPPAEASGPDHEAAATRAAATVAVAEPEPAAAAPPPDRAEEAAPQEPPESRVVTLVKSPDRGLGISISGGSDTDLQHVFARRVYRDTPAYGKVLPGDRLLRINGQSMTGMTHAMAVRTVQKCPPRVTLEVVTPRKGDDADAAYQSPTPSPTVVAPAMALPAVAEPPRMTTFQASTIAPHPEDAAAPPPRPPKSAAVVSMAEAPAAPTPDPDPAAAAAAAPAEGTKAQAQLPEGNQLSLVVREDDKGFGFAVSGGTDKSKPLYVKGVLEKRAAQRAGLQKGDIILSVNERDCSKMTHQEGLGCIREAKPEARMVILRPDRSARKRSSRRSGRSSKSSRVSSSSSVGRPVDDEMPATKHVRLEKGATGLGVSLKSDGKGIYVDKVLPTGAAAKDGQLQHGCRILSVNGEPLAGVGKREALAIFQRTGAVVELEIIPSMSRASSLRKSQGASKQRRPRSAEVSPAQAPKLPDDPARPRSAEPAPRAPTSPPPPPKPQPAADLPPAKPPHSVSTAPGDVLLPVPAAGGPVRSASPALSDVNFDSDDDALPDDDSSSSRAGPATRAQAALTTATPTAAPAEAGAADGGAAAAVPKSSADLIEELMAAPPAYEVYEAERARALAALGPRTVDDALRRRLRHLAKAVEAALKSGVPSQEFQQLQKYPYKFDNASASLPANAPLNRYGNIWPEESTRVRLSSGPTDYINGNELTVPLGAGRTCAMILTQGPKENTCVHFWRMILEQKAKAIVMVTSLKERNRQKCHEYWPPKKGKKFRFEEMLVENLNVAERDGHDVTALRVTDTTTKETCEVTHLRLKVWPDFGVPDNPEAVLELLDDFEGFQGTFGTPGVTHCSAGVGRSGVFTTCYAIKQHLFSLQEDEPDLSAVPIKDIVLQMRKARHRMVVQTEAQYEFCYQSFLALCQRLADS